MQRHPMPRRLSLAFPSLESMPRLHSEEQNAMTRILKHQMLQQSECCRATTPHAKPFASRFLFPGKHAKLPTPVPPPIPVPLTAKGAVSRRAMGADPNGKCESCEQTASLTASTTPLLSMLSQGAVSRRAMGAGDASDTPGGQLPHVRRPLALCEDM